MQSPRWDVPPVTISDAVKLEIFMLTMRGLVFWSKALEECTFLHGWQSLERRKVWGGGGGGIMNIE